MTDLRSRILSGSGPDRELDALVWVEFRGRTEKRTRAECATPPPYTAHEGVGHCIALKDEVLPGWHVETIRQYALEPHEFRWGVDLMDSRKWREAVEADHKDLCRALLAAILDAKAQEARND